MAGSQSSDLIYAEVQRELDAQLAHFEGLDAKAGIVLGFSGVLVVLSSSSVSLAVLLLRGFGACAALAAVASFWPRRYPIFRVRALRDKYLRAENAFTQVSLLDTHVEMVELASTLIMRKAKWLKVSIVFLVIAVAVSALLLTWAQGGSP